MNPFVSKDHAPEPLTWEVALGYFEPPRVSEAAYRRKSVVASYRHVVCFRQLF